MGLSCTVLWVFFNYLVWLLPAQPETHELGLADLDGDGDLDAFLANSRNEAAEPNTVLLNDGHGYFQDSGQRLGEFESRDVVLADFDDDGDMDALVSNISWGETFWNDSHGQFQHRQSIFKPANAGYFVGLWRFQSGDLNGDDGVDLFLIGCCGGGISNGDAWQTLNAFNSIWLSDNSGLPTSSGQEFGLGNSEAVALGDLDGDGDLDAFLANSTHLDEQGNPVDYDPNEVWFNDGRGTFADSGQKLGRQRSYSVAVGDLDDDGDLDALVGNGGADELWWNDGRGYFSTSPQTLGNTLTRYVYLADLDGDGDLDAFLGSDTQGGIWLNNGRGHFTQSQQIRYSNRQAIALGDVNGDGSVDIVAGQVNGATVWFNDNTGQFRK